MWGSIVFLQSSTGSFHNRMHWHLKSNWTIQLSLFLILFHNKRTVMLQEKYLQCFCRHVSSFKTSNFVCSFTFCISKMTTEMIDRSNLLQLILTCITFNSRCPGNEIFKCAFKIQMGKTKMFQDVCSPNSPKPH